MLSYIVRRLLGVIPVMLVVGIFVFSLLHLAPGDPAAIIAGDNATEANVARIRASENGERQGNDMPGKSASCMSLRGIGTTRARGGDHVGF